MNHPCRECGACCKVFGVQFHEEQLVSNGGAVPDELTVRAESPGHRRMRRSPSASCIGLAGTPGEFTTCTLYCQRPQPCDDFKASWEHGEANPWCDEARAQIGLPPLEPEDWGYQEE